MDMELFHWNSGVSEKFNISKYRGTYCTGLDHLVGVIMCYIAYTLMTHC